MAEHKIIECPHCDSKVNAKVLGKREYGPNGNPDPICFYFLECPSCESTMVGLADLVQIDHEQWEYNNLYRLWPADKRDLDGSIPKLVRRSIDEGKKCLKAKAYSACAVMCGKALEALCKDQGAKDWQLAKGLKELKDGEIIDGRLYEWGEALRKRRNIGAHASEEDISREDAEDVLDFAIAICEFVYVLSDKYEKFKAREASKLI